MANRVVAAMPSDKRILIVDDEPLIRQYIRDVLQDDGYTVIEAANVEEALLLLAVEDVATVLADIEMPGEDGVFLLRTIKRKWPDVKLIIMSGRVLPKRTELPEGTNLLAKPFSADRLLLLVGNE